MKRLSRHNQTKKYKNLKLIIYYKNKKMSNIVINNNITNY